METDVFL